MNWKRGLKWIAGGLLAVAGLALVVGVVQVTSFGRAASFRYNVDPLDVEATLDSTMLERGQHLAESIGGCLGCHGPELGGSQVEDLGPIGIIRAPNLTTGVGGVGGSYTDGEWAGATRTGSWREPFDTESIRTAEAYASCPHLNTTGGPTRTLLRWYPSCGACPRWIPRLRRL